MEVTTHLKKRAKNYNMAWQYLVMADLLAIGYGEADSYAIAFSENTALSVQKNASIRENIMKNTKFQELLLTRKKAIASRGKNNINDAGDIELIGAEETAREILKIAQTMPEGSKERGEMFVRYADLIRKNDTQTTEDDDPVRIYLPAKCSMCPLKMEFDLKEQQKSEKPIA